MMKLWSLLPLVGLLAACRHTYDESAKNRVLYAARQTESSQTITVERQACTGCTETAMHTGRLLIPSDLRVVLHDSVHWRHDVQLAGHFPFELLDATGLYSPHSFTITGKVIGTYDGGGNLDGGPVPLFYVESW